MRQLVLLFILALIVEYLVIPELVGASKDLYLLGRIGVLWTVAGIVLEAASLFCYALLTRELLPPQGRPGICPGCSASTCPPRRWRTSSRRAPSAARASATSCSPRRAWTAPTSA